MSRFMPNMSENSLNNPTHAFRSEVQLLQCTMATASPIGVVTMSSSSCTFLSSSSRTTMANTEVPAETLPVRTATELVAHIPVPASPSGGARGIPSSSLPVVSRSFAPSAVNVPAFSPATRTFGRISDSFQGYFCTFGNASNCASMV